MRTIGACSLPFVLAVACGGGGDPVDAGRSDTGLIVPAESCSQPGDEGNELGVGTFCTPRGGECRAFPSAGLCLAMVAPDEGQWFCTRTCTMDSQCGSDAVCFGDARGRACVPARCAPEPDDAGVPDASSDDGGAPGDAAPPEDAGVGADASSASDAG